MRKKSHILLARFLLNGLNDELLSRRWKAFYVGSLLPDCRPSFLLVRHEYDVTIDMVEAKIRRLAGAANLASAASVRDIIDLGQVFHYIADYFTFPHNRNYPGNLRDHCAYEEGLKLGLRSYIREGHAVFHSEGAAAFRSVEDILDYIRRSHQEYMLSQRSVEEDCEYITRVCSRALAGVVSLTHGACVAYAA